MYLLWEECFCKKSKVLEVRAGSESEIFQLKVAPPPELKTGFFSHLFLLLSLNLLLNHGCGASSLRSRGDTS
ncbi:hypothetical protein CapIbe_010218 [Capra ibex]